jgi:hypothetical protein
METTRHSTTVLRARTAWLLSMLGLLWAFLPACAAPSGSHSSATDGMAWKDIPQHVEVIWPQVMEVLEERGYRIKEMRGQVSSYHEASGEGFSTRIEKRGESSSRIWLRIGAMDPEEKQESLDLLAEIASRLP